MNCSVMSKNIKVKILTKRPAAEEILSSLELDQWNDNQPGFWKTSQNIYNWIVLKNLAYLTVKISLQVW